jgi:hypothetical protein
MAKGEKMKKDVKTAWVAALRSGEYQQGEGVLRREKYDGSVVHCCLGVLCEVLSKDGDLKFQDEGHGQGSGLRFYGQQKDGDGNNATGSAFSLPYMAQELAGIKTDNGEYEDEDGNMRSLIRHNDGDGFTFAEIADIIEKNF